MTLEELRSEATAAATKAAQNTAARKLIAAATRDQREQAREIVREGGAAGFRDALKQVPKLTPRVEITTIGNTSLPGDNGSKGGKEGDGDGSSGTVDVELCDGSILRCVGEIIPPP